MSDRRLALPQLLSSPLYTGYVNKQGGSHKSWKTRFAILYPHLLVYYANSAKYEFDVKRGSLENRKNHVVLEGAQVVICRGSDEKLKFAFSIIVTATDNKRNSYVIANSSYSERDLWMEKVSEAISGGAATAPPNYKARLLTKQSTLRLLDSDVAESVRGAMVNKDSESDIDDTDSENEGEPNRRTTKSQAPLSAKSHSTALPDVKGADGALPVLGVTTLSTTGANQPRPLLQKDMLTLDPGMATHKEEGGKSMDDYEIKPGKQTGGGGNVSSLEYAISTEETIVTFGSCLPSKVMLGKEGFLSKQGGKHKTWKYRYVIAVPGRLAYYKSKPHSPGDKAMGIVKLKNITCCAKSGVPKFPNLFEITSNSQWNKRGTYVFSAASSEERADWIEALEILGGDCKAHIEELADIQETRRDPIGSEKRAISFSEAVAMSIDEDDYIPKKPTPSQEQEGYFGQESVVGINVIPVSQPPTTKTKRHVEGSYDLDLSFITDRILVMSFPYSAEEMAHFHTKGRHEIGTVERFLNEKYGTAYRVYNLCKEKTYPSDRFNGNLALYPFEDHCPPPLSMIHEFIRDMQAWLGKNSKNVSVVHCNSGKGRSGCMIASYLIYDKEIFYHEAIDLFNTHRINFGRGLSVPSHLRYIRYVDRIHLNPKEYSFDRDVERVIESIQIHRPSDTGADWKPFVTVVSMETNVELFNSVKDGETAQNLKLNMVTIRKINCRVKKDIQVNVWDFEDMVNKNLSLDAYLFFNTSFITEDTAVFKKPDLDKLYKCKVQGFSLSIKFAPLAKP